ncbi:accessory gland protein Acp29AB [Drosophila bipectinata]|uniref:accessory gland protein Acp29AB n=1 Tax=Drosophila bipectinata TaxID=42026 RepID=UPI001C8A8E2C|nr:accessory gland protein Acp29AB [Drosophila bipectinata]
MCESVFILSIILLIGGSLGESQDTRSTACEVQDPPKQCSEFCLLLLKPLANHISYHQEEWNKCNTINNQTQVALGTMMDKQTTLQVGLTRIEEKESDIETKVAALENIISEKLQEIVNATKSLQNKMEEHFSKIENSLLKIKFQSSGSKHFYIEKNMLVDWKTAESKCREMGGQLASIENDDELDLIIKDLKADTSYWIDINDIQDEGKFISSVTGKSPTYFKWHSKQPVMEPNNEQDCVFIYNKKMQDYDCNDNSHFICQNTN